nr:MAG TPA: hypothetical protein [Caudoviricetes sp.]
MSMIAQGEGLALGGGGRGQSIGSLERIVDSHHTHLVLLGEGFLDLPNPHALCQESQVITLHLKSACI